MSKLKDLFLLAIFISLGFTPAFAIASTAARAVSSPYYFTFNSDGNVEEKGSMGQSDSPYWWVNSGGEMLIKGGKGSTMLGDAPAGNFWRDLYGRMNPLDTDNGLNPQNTFRLVSRNQWLNLRNDGEFKIIKDNLSASPNRNSSNGILLMDRYVDSQNLYYFGLRVDGAAVIKKKVNGVYTTLGYNKLLPGTYDRITNPNLIPKNTSIVLRSEVTNISGGVNLKLYLDIGKTGIFTKVLEATDTGTAGGAPITTSGYSGIRTDFMDVQFGTWKMWSI